MFPDVSSILTNFIVTWHIAALLDEDGIRQKIGNSMFIIIYSDGILSFQFKFSSTTKHLLTFSNELDPEPFDPSFLYLGQLSTVVCVVRPVNVLSENLAIFARQQFQYVLFHFFHREILQVKMF